MAADGRSLPAAHRQGAAVSGRPFAAFQLRLPVGEIHSSPSQKPGRKTRPVVALSGLPTAAQLAVNHLMKSFLLDAFIDLDRAENHADALKDEGLDIYQYEEHFDQFLRYINSVGEGGLRTRRGIRR